MVYENHITNQSVPAPAGSDAAAGVALASIGKRFAAILLDVLVVGVPMSLVYRAIAGAPERGQRPGVGWFVVPALFLLYEAAFTAQRGQSLGKMIMKIKVVGPGSTVPGWARAFRRFTPPMLVALIPFVGGLLALGMLLRAAFVADRRGIHDLIGDTAVVVA